jgi:hypothetical protein
LVEICQLASEFFGMAPGQATLAPFGLGGGQERYTIRAYRRAILKALCKLVTSRFAIITYHARYPVLMEAQ